MSEIQFGQSLFAWKDARLQVYSKIDGQPEIDLNAQQVQQLARFLQIELYGNKDQRRGFRVPLMQPCDLTVKVDSNDQGPTTVTPRDISFTGILVEYARDQVPNLLIGNHVSVTLNYQDIETKIEGTVSRRNQNQYAIFFEDSIKKGELVPPEKLYEIVSHLERHWLDTKSV